jgi:enamine deaminase RidA (YjgF/YER057c/UK114 family)
MTNNSDRTSKKRLASFNHPWEKGDIYGFSQAVQVGSRIYVAGQTATNPDGDMESQMREAYASIEAALSQLGATMANVVDETIYVTDIEAAGLCAARVRNNVFNGCFELASTLIGITRLGHPDILVEIKCTAEV